MCGLVGMVGALEHKHRNVMKDLFFLNTLRGRDSTGLTSVSRDKVVRTRKLTVPGYDFIEIPVVDRAMCSGDQLWMGHGRYKTTGEVSRANAHPFEVLDDEGDVLLVGTHNGTLTNKYQLENLLKDKYDTDSEALFNYLVDAPNFKAAVGKLRGAWSLVFWDPTTDCLHFCRNEERPLTFAWSKDRKVLVWASEAWMIINACRRNGMELEQNDKGLSCYSTLADSLYTLEIPQGRDKVLPDLKREGGYVGEPTKTFQQDWKPKWNSWWNHDPNDPEFDQEREKEAAKGKKETTTVIPPKAEPKKVVRFGEVSGPHNTVISLAEFKRIRDKGCGWCKEEISEGMVYSFLDDENLCCVRCMRDTHPKTDPLDDDLPFDLTDKGEKVRQENSKEYKKVIVDAAKKVVG